MAILNPKNRHDSLVVGAPVNAQLYNCGRPAAQTWAWDITGSGEIRKSLAGATAAGGAEQLQSVSIDNPSLAPTLTCPH